MKNKKIKIIFGGSGFFSTKILEYLLEKKINPILILTQSAKPRKRGLKLESTEIALLAQKRKISYLEIEKFNQEIILKLKSLKPDIILTASFGKIIPKTVLGIPQRGSINIHPSLLPKLRGPAPIQFALLNNFKDTGTTLFLMNEKMDQGPILSQKKVNIDSRDNFFSLEKKLIKASCAILLPTLENWIKGKIKPRKQNEKLATYSTLIRKEMGQINWRKETAEEILAKFKAFLKWPKIYSFVETSKGIKKITLEKVSIFKNYAKIESDSHFGKIVCLDKNTFIVKARKGWIKLEKLQLEGKKTHSAQDFFLGKKELIGKILA